LADVTTTDREVKVIVEMPGVNKENIRVNVYGNSVEITTTDPEKRLLRFLLKQISKQPGQLTKMEYFK
jgi:HSP20 family molecular chaperone IbpA